MNQETKAKLAVAEAIERGMALHMTVVEDRRKYLAKRGDEVHACALGFAALGHEMPSTASNGRNWHPCEIRKFVMVHTGASRELMLRISHMHYSGQPAESIAEQLRWEATWPRLAAIARWARRNGLWSA